MDSDEAFVFIRVQLLFSSSRKGFKKDSFPVTHSASERPHGETFSGMVLKLTTEFPFAWKLAQNAEHTLCAKIRRASCRRMKQKAKCIADTRRTGAFFVKQLGSRASQR